MELGQKEWELKIKTMNQLVICHSYQYLQKDITDVLAQYFKNVDVLVRRNPFAEIAQVIPINGLKRYSKKNKIAGDSPSNVRILDTPIYYFPFDRSYKNLGQRHYFAIKKTKLDTRAYNLIHCHFLWSSGYVGARIKEETGLPLVVTAHGYDAYALPFKDFEWRERIEYVLNSSDHIITVSQNNLKKIRDLNSSVPVSVIPNGFNRDLFCLRNSLECRKQLGLPLSHKIIVAVGNLEPIKGYDHLIDAIGIVTKNYDDVLCILIGSGSMFHTLKHKIRKDNLENHIIMVGAKSHEETAIWMCASDIVVLSSLNEGNPSVMFEALGCGKPFIGTRVGGVPEVITSEDYGLLVEPANPEDLAEKILISLNREWDQKKILDHAGQFTWDSIAKQIIDVYKQVLKENPE